MNGKNIFNFLVWEKRMAILLSLDREKNFTQLRKEARVTARTLSNALKELINFGADMIAVVSDIWKQEDITKRALEYKKLFED